MNIYVEKNELPKTCVNCPCCTWKVRHICSLDNGNDDYFLDEEGGTCPLQTIQSVQNEKAVEVLEKIKEKVGYKYNSQLVISSKFLIDYINTQISELKGEK